VLDGSERWREVEGGKRRTAGREKRIAEGGAEVRESNKYKEAVAAWGGSWSLPRESENKLTAGRRTRSELGATYVSGGGWGREGSNRRGRRGGRACEFVKTRRG